MYLWGGDGYLAACWRLEPGSPRMGAIVCFPFWHHVERRYRAAGRWPDDAHSEHVVELPFSNIKMLASKAMKSLEKGEPVDFF